MNKVLTIAGSDSGGGSGIQADLKTILSLGGYGMSVVTAVTAQNTLGIQGMVPIAPEFVALQLESTLGDIGADCVKTGMLVNDMMMQYFPEIIDLNFTATMEADLDKIADTLVRVSQLVTDFPEIVELDINPLLVFPAGQGVLGLDMRLALKA